MRTLRVSRSAALASSYMDFHARGLDYLCLQRSELMTLKVYFFDRAAPAGQVVAPHDHRYDFQTRVLAGELHNWRYTKCDREDRRAAAIADGAQPFERFLYDTPLNGGDGFSYADQVLLLRHRRETYGVGSAHAHYAHELHTIGVPSDRTVIELVQSADVVPVGLPTQLFKPCGQKEPPSLDGLYNRMTDDRLDQLLGLYQELSGARLEMVD